MWEKTFENEIRGKETRDTKSRRVTTRWGGRWQSCPRKPRRPLQLLVLHKEIVLAHALPATCVKYPKATSFIPVCLHSWISIGYT
eukprot:scaffold676_cov316-Pavlova_lutheri.AAC.49